MEVKGVAGGDLVQNIPSDKYKDKEKVRNRGTVQTPYTHIYMRQLQMFQKVEFCGGPIFKVILEC